MELDEVTLARAKRGDRAAQDVFLRAYAPALHALVRRTSVRGEADDLTQELLGKLLAALPRFDPAGPAKLSTWVYTIAQRWLIDVNRRRHLSVAPLEDGLQVADSAQSAEKQLAGRQLGAELETALQTLPEAQRRAFVLVHVHERALEEVAQAEEVPIGTVKSRLHRAKAALALQLLHHRQGQGGSDAVSR
ncbi:MAG: sigma-70 family RNA polymerase sigma factor [Myxococcaceae bacterium]